MLKQTTSPKVPASELPILIRKPVQSDLPYVIDSWLRANLKSPFGRRHKFDVYYPHHRKVVFNILAADETRLLMCCGIEDPDQLFGWVCYAPEKVLHFVEVKRAFRGMGIARLMLERAGISHEEKVPFSHVTNHSHKLEGYRTHNNIYLALEHYNGGKIEKSSE